MFFNLIGANTNDAIEKMQARLCRRSWPRTATRSCSTAKLFARVKTLYDQRDTLGLDAEGVRLLERYHTDFVRAGAKLSDADKAKLKAINARAGHAGHQVQPERAEGSQRLGRSWSTPSAELDGLSDEQIAAAAEAAKARRLEGKYVHRRCSTPPASRPWRR